MVKRILAILSVVSAAFFFSSCKKGTDSEHSISAPVISALENTSFTLTEEGDAFVMRMTWSKALKSVGGSVDKSVTFSYELEYALTGSDNYKSLYSGGNNYFDLYMRNLSSIYLDLDNSDGKDPVVAALRVKASGDAGTSLSEPVLITIYPVEEEPEPQELTSVDKPVFNAPASTEFRLQDPGEQDAVLTTITWKAPVFHFGDQTGTVTPLTYDVEFDSKNNNFARGKVISAGTDASVTLRHRQIQEILLEWGAKPLMAYEAELRIKATYGSGETSGVIYSDILSVVFIPYASFSATQLVWMIGDFNQWNASSISTMWPLFKDTNSAEDGLYYYVGYLPAETYFKFLPEMSLGSYLCFCNDSSNEGHIVLKEAEDGAFWNEIAGFKKITLDTKAMTFSIQDYDVSGVTTWTTIGFIGTFNDWSADIPMDKASADNCHLWVKEMSMGTSSMTYHCGKFRAENSWTSLWNNILGKEWETPFGKMTTEKSPDVNIYVGPEAADYYVAFNDLTCNYILYKKP